MAHAYTPGLQVTERTVIRKVRLLPMQGQVLVRKGQEVEADTVVARADLPGDVHPVNVVNRLGIQPDEINLYMLKEVGDEVAAGEPIAQTRPWIRFLKTTCPAPVAGTIQSVSAVTGQVMVQAPPQPVELLAYVRGHVVEIRSGEGAVIESRAALVQGIFGIGGERTGRLLVAVDSPDSIISPAATTARWQGAVVVAGALITADLVKAAAAARAVALLGGGIPAGELYDILGYEIGVAVTGSEKVGLSVIVTEGFGHIAMAPNTFRLLKALEGQTASVNGATQIRAGVQRPEVIVPLQQTAPVAAGKAAEHADGLTTGDAVRLIREPYFGRMGRVAELVPELERIETGARVRVMHVELDGGETVLVPRANVEIIET